MRRSALNRYERNDEGEIIVDVSVDRIEYLYNNFDKSAPYIRRDLDQEFAEYLIGCVRELNHFPFIIRLNLPNTPDESVFSRLQHSIKTYFEYLAESGIRKILRMFRRSGILFMIGIGLLSASVWFNRTLGSERSVTSNVFAEGLTVAAWVSLWEALAVFLIEWSPRRRNVVMYRRLANARLIFRTSEDNKNKKR